MIRALIFDCFGVLYSDGLRYIEMLSPSDKRADLKNLYRQTDYGFTSRDEFLQVVSELTGITLTNFSEIELL